MVVTARGWSQGWSTVDCGSEDLTSQLVDVSKVRLADLPDLAHPRLAQALRDVVDQVSKEQEVVAGFGSSI
jgi:FXSXX-COOH protein